MWYVPHENNILADNDDIIDIDTDESKKGIYNALYSIIIIL